MFPSTDFFDDNSNYWTDLESMCISWDNKIIKISNLQEFFTLNDAVSDADRFFYKPYYVILRTTYNHASIVEMLYSWFSKLFKIEIIELAWDEVKFSNAFPKKLARDLRPFLIEFEVLRPNLWKTKSLAKLVYYSFVLLELLDYKFCPQNQRACASLEEIIFNLFMDNQGILVNNTSSFFHSELAELITTLQRLRRKECAESWRLLRAVPSFINTDINGIPFTLQSRYDINEVLNRVDEYDATKITDEIFIQYETMRRNF